MAVEGLLEKNLPPDILDDRSQKKVRRCDLGIAASSLGDLGIAHDNPSSKDVLMASDGEAFFSDDNMESNNKGFFEKESIDGSEGKNVDLEMENFDEFRVEIVDGVPSITISNRKHEKLSRRWQRSVVVRLHGSPLSYRLLCRKIETLCRPKGRFTIMDLDEVNFLVKSSKEGDYLKALLERPWTI
ncbi:PREDICTED: uncharacterized protein LOC18589747 [Theobroma cacao]|uniref:Uncharacterized protein LOC18589747 n=1 Tax=Theobroma cacao TaxID=3641 RepID=A0AB32WY39_THECC|nr:PREDICTED: uncharacterized protein LOC18589747 [Theobroma cacao]